MTESPSAQGWLAQNLRLTVFFADQKVDVDVPWWAESVGKQPDVDTTQRNVPAVHQHGLVADGTATLSMDYQPGRVDWVVSPILPQGIVEQVPNFGTYEQGIGLLKGIIETWLTKAPAFVRIALGGIFVIPVKDKIAGYEEVQRFLPSLKLDAVNSSDFLYQINKPRYGNTLPSRDLINRLSKWSVMSVKPIQFFVPVSVDQSFGGIVPQSLVPVSYGYGSTPSTPVGPELSAIRAELDINTSADNLQTIPNELSRPLFFELMSLSDELLTAGDIP